MSLYNSFKVRKTNGMLLDFKSITKKELQTLFFEETINDAQIADLFNVTHSTVRNKRKKLGINLRDLTLYSYMESIPIEINEKSKEELIAIGNLSKISKAITHFAFRNGPVEDMHANNQLSDKDMETLNKFMVNRLAYIFKLIIEEKWVEIEFLINITDKFYGQSWDNAKPDDGGNEKLLLTFLKMPKRK